MISQKHRLKLITNILNYLKQDEIDIIVIADIFNTSIYKQILFSYELLDQIDENYPFDALREVVMEYKGDKYFLQSLKKLKDPLFFSYYHQILIKLGATKSANYVNNKIKK